MGGVNSVNITSFELKDSSVTDNNEQLFTDPKLLAAIRQSVTNFTHDDARRHTLHDTFSCSFNSAQSSHEQIY